MKGKNYIHADYFALTEEIESWLQSIKIFLAKIIPEEIFVIVSVFKTNSWKNKIKDLNKKTVMRSLMKEKCCWANYK